MSGEVVECDEHGSALATVVCAHVVQSLVDCKPYGFLWTLDDDQEYSAVCDQCNAMTDAEWERDAEGLGRVLCFECFCNAGRLNGVTLPGIR